MTLKSLSSIPLLLSGLILLLAPVLSPRRLFFAVRVEPDFRSTQPARKALQHYRWAVAAVTLAGLLWLFFRPETGSALLTAYTLQTAVALILWRRTYRALLKYQIGVPTVASVELTTELDRLPRYFWMATVPPIILAATALFLHIHWSDIPVRFAIHWGLDGQANGWATRSARGVYGPLLLAALLMVWLVGMAFASWYGTRRSPMRAAMAKMMIAMEFLFSLVFGTVSLLALYRPSGVVLNTIILGGVAGTIIYSFVLLRRASSACSADEPIAAAYGGSSFFDRQNAAILLPRADGLGYTPNLAHPVAWILLVYPLLVGAVAMKFIL